MSLNPPISHWRGKRVWIVGASSGIGRATASALHARGAQVVVSARNADALDAFVAEHAGALSIPFDATDLQATLAACTEASAGGPLDLAGYFAGYYTAQRATAFNLGEMLKHEQVNYVGALYWLDGILPGMLQRKAGHIALVSSVAGFRGLPQSLGYGPTKAALINLAETLYIDLHDEGLGVSVINPGFVETPLTAQNQFAMPALITPQQAAQEILAGWERGLFDIHFPKRFTRWMKLLRILPYAAYFRITRKFTGL